MPELTYTLLAEGTSDRALMPILDWLLQEMLADHAVTSQWADLRIVPHAPRGNVQKMKAALTHHPCDLLFVHRDADAELRETRAMQIRHDFAELSEEERRVPGLCVVPVREQEAWLLIEERALFRAAGNPNGRQRLPMPRLADLESLPDPKQILRELLMEASGLSPQRRKKFDAAESALLVTQYIEDFSPLRRLLAFQSLERELEEVIQAQGGDNAHGELPPPRRVEVFTLPRYKTTLSSQSVLAN